MRSKHRRSNNTDELRVAVRLLFRCLQALFDQPQDRGVHSPDLPHPIGGGVGHSAGIRRSIRRFSGGVRNGKGAGDGISHPSGAAEGPPPVVYYAGDYTAARYVQ